MFKLFVFILALFSFGTANAHPHNTEGLYIEVRLGGVWYQCDRSIWFARNVCLCPNVGTEIVYRTRPGFRVRTRSYRPRVRINTRTRVNHRRNYRRSNRIRHRTATRGRARHRGRGTARRHSPRRTIRKTRSSRRTRGRTRRSSRRT